MFRRTKFYFVDKTVILGCFSNFTMLRKVYCEEWNGSKIYLNSDLNRKWHNNEETFLDALFAIY